MPAWYLDYIAVLVALSLAASAIAWLSPAARDEERDGYTAFTFLVAIFSLLAFLAWRLS